MRKPRRSTLRFALLISTIGALGVTMGLCYVWLDITIGEPIRMSPGPAGDPSSEFDDQLMVACPALRGGRAHQRTAETIVDFSAGDGDLTAVRIRQILTTDATDPLVNCARSADQLGAAYLADRLTGYVSISNVMATVTVPEVNGPLIEASDTDSKSVITFVTEAAYGLAAPVLSFGRPSGTLAPNRITVNGNHLVITSIRGSPEPPPVLRQTASHVELAERVGDQSVELGLTEYRTSKPRPLLVPDSRSTPNSSNAFISGAQNYAVFAVLMLFPWAVVVFLGRRSTDPLRLIMRRNLGLLSIAVAAAGIPIALSNLAGWAGWVDPDSARLASRLGLLAMWIVLPLGLHRWWLREGQPARRFARRVLLVDTTALGVTVVLLIGAGFRPWVWALPAIVLAGACGAGLFAGLDRRRLSWLVGLSFGLVCTAGIVLLRFLDTRMPYALWVLVVLAFWMELVYRLVAAGSAVRHRWYGLAAAVAVGLSLMPLSMLLFDWATLLGERQGAAVIPEPEDLFAYLWLLANVALGVTAMVVLRRRGAEPAILADPLYRGLACAAVLVTLYAGFSGTFWVIAAAVAAIGFGWLLSGNTPANTVRLAGVSTAVHARLVGLEGHRRALLEMAKAHFRSAGSAIVDGGKSISAAARTQSVLDTAAGLSRPPDPYAVRLPRAALGSGAGAAPWRNARQAGLCAALLSAPFVVLFEAIPLLVSLPTATYTPTAFWLGHLVWWGRWIVYGLVFGYFYPAVRGSTPMRKSGLLLVVLLPLELLAVDFSQPLPDMWVETVVRAGHVVVFCLGLGLFWELRLVRAAGFNWGRVRNFGKIRSLVLPATTVLVAAVTALVTVLAGAAVSPPQVPNDKPPTTTPSPR